MEPECGSEMGASPAQRLGRGPVSREQWSRDMSAGVSFAYVLVGLQFLLSAVLVVTVRVDEISSTAVTISGAGVLLWSWALASMKLHRLSVRPDVRHDAELVTRGPYNRVRHPMYSGLALFTLGCVQAPFQWWTLAVWLILLAVLQAKSHVEERRLLERFPDYEAYCHRTKRFIPFLF